MLKPTVTRFATCFTLALSVFHAPDLYAGSTTSLANFTGPIQTVIDWVTGDIGRLVSIVVLAFFGMYLWKKRAEDKAERGLLYLLGTAIVLGATNIVDGLGFTGAIF